MDAVAQEKVIKQLYEVDIKQFETKVENYFEQVLKKLNTKDQNIFVSEKDQTQ